VRGEDGVDERLTLEELMRRDEDAHDEIEAKDGLPEGSPDRCVDDLGTLATQACPGSARRLVSQAIERTFIRRLGQLRADIGLEIAEGLGLIEPA